MGRTAGFPPGVSRPILSVMADTQVRPRPDRNPIVVDIEDGTIRAGEHQGTLPTGAPTTDQVLASYLSLVYTMRHATPGSAVPLREADLEVLGRALELAVPEVSERLHGLMAPVTVDAPVRRTDRVPR